MSAGAALVAGDVAGKAAENAPEISKAVTDYKMKSLAQNKDEGGDYGHHMSRAAW